MRYEMNFGDANAGGVPTFAYFVRQDTGGAISQPTIVEASWLHGAYYFDFDWSTTAATTISWKAELNGIEQADIISAPGITLPGTSTASSATTSLTGFSTVGTIINRMAVQCGLATVADPFASTDPNFVQFIEYLNTLGSKLAKRYEWEHLVRECTITTAASATSYALPSDYKKMLDQSGWNRTSQLPLAGPMTSQQTQYLKGRTSNVIINVAFRLQGNLITFPVVPSNAQTLVFEYISSFWIQTAASGTGPDADHATASTDYVRFDPDLVVAGVKLAWLADRGFETTKAENDFDEQLESALGANSGAPVLSLSGPGYGTSERLLDVQNLPVTGYGA